VTLDDPESLLKLIQQHLSWYPLMQPRDVYKLLYQGVMGSEHMINPSRNSPVIYTLSLSNCSLTQPNISSSQFDQMGVCCGLTYAVINHASLSSICLLNF
jgi:hypothetical protein